MPDTDQRVLEGLGRQLTDRRRMLLTGARHIGWKMAFGAPAMMERLHLGVAAPGFLTDRTLIEDGASVSTGGWTGPVIEFEIALHLGADLAAGASPEQARAAVAGIAPAIELADVDLPLVPDRVADIVAGNIFHRGVILGEPSFARPGADLTGLVADIAAGDDRRTVTDLEALTGDYGTVLAAAADALAQHGARMTAGDVIIGGSVIPPIPIVGRTVFEYHLEGFPHLTVSAG
jgi:2-keto-4-pentenoate hydratase